MFLEYTTADGHQYALRPEQVRGIDGKGDRTRILATIGGQSLFIHVARPYKEVLAEWKKAIERETEAVP